MDSRCLSQVYIPYCLLLFYFNDILTVHIILEAQLMDNRFLSQVYGIPDHRMGEEVCASVILKSGAMVTEADIKAYSKGKVCFGPRLVFLFDSSTEVYSTVSYL